MASILSRKQNIKTPVKKTREEYAEDALYREVWEDVNNEKTQQFLKKYWRHIVAGVLAIMIVVSGVQLGRRMYYSSQNAKAMVYEQAIGQMDANALHNFANHNRGATADLALFQSYLIDKDITKLEQLAEHGHTRDFKDLAKIHIASINGDKMSADEMEEFLSSMNTKKSPFFYTSRLLIAQRYLSDGVRDLADKYLDVIINDNDAPATVQASAQMLK